MSSMSTGGSVDVSAFTLDDWRREAFRQQDENTRLREAMSIYRRLAAFWVAMLKEAPSYAQAQDAYTKALRLEQPEAFARFHDPMSCQDGHLGCELARDEQAGRDG